MGRRLLSIVAGAVVAVVLGLTASSPALAQGGGSSPSAGDNQYIDPLATNPPSHPAKKHKTSTSQAASAPAASSGSSASAPNQPAQPSYGTGAPSSGSSVSAGSAGGAAATAPPTATASPPATAPPTHSLQRTHKSPTKPVVGHRTTTPVAAPVSAASSPASAVTPPTHSAGTSPYIYLAMGLCAAAGIGLVARRLLVRRAVHRA